MVSVSEFGYIDWYILFMHRASDNKGSNTLGFERCQVFATNHELQLLDMHFMNMIDYTSKVHFLIFFMCL